MTKITRAVGKAKVVQLAPDNTNRLITEAVLRELLFDLWDSGALQIDEKNLFNLRELSDRDYEAKECMIYDDGSGFEIYRANLGVSGIPFNSANWTKITGTNQAQDLQQTLDQGNSAEDQSITLTNSSNPNNVIITTERFYFSGGVVGGGGSTLDVTNGKLDFQSTSATHVGEFLHTDLIRSRVSTPTTSVGYSLGNGDGMFIGSYNQVQTDQATAKLHVRGSVRFQDLPTSVNLTSVLAIDANGNIKTQTLPSASNPSLRLVCAVGSDWDMNNSSSPFLIGELKSAGANRNDARYAISNVQSTPTGSIQFLSREWDANGDLLYSVQEKADYAKRGSSGASLIQRDSYSSGVRSLLQIQSRGFIQLSNSGYQNDPLYTGRENDISFNLSKLDQADKGFAYFTRFGSGFEGSVRLKDHDEMVRIEGELYLSNAKTIGVSEQSSLRIETLDADEDATKMLVYDEATGLVKKANKTGGSGGGDSSYTTAFFYPGNLPVNTTFNLGYGMGSVKEPVANYNQLMPAIVGGSSILQFIGVLSGGNYIAQSDTDFVITVKIYNISKSNPITSSISSSANLPNNASWKTLAQANLSFVVDPTIKFYRTDMINLSGQTDVKSLDANWTDADRYICVCQISQTNTPFNSPVPDVYVELDWKG